MEKLVKIVYDGDRGGDVMLTVKTKEAHDDWAVLSISKNPDDDYEIHHCIFCEKVDDSQDQPENYTNVIFQSYAHSSKYITAYEHIASGEPIMKGDKLTECSFWQLRDYNEEIFSDTDKIGRVVLYNAHFDGYLVIIPTNNGFDFRISRDKKNMIRKHGAFIVKEITS